MRNTQLALLVGLFACGQVPTSRTGSDGQGTNGGSTAGASAVTGADGGATAGAGGTNSGSTSSTSGVTPGGSSSGAATAGTTAGTDPSLPSCVDADGDGRGAHCASIDCNDNDDQVWVSCDTCHDLDGDGFFQGCDRYTTQRGGDCNDADGLVTNAQEVPGDGIDQDCDGHDFVASNANAIFVALGASLDAAGTMADPIVGYGAAYTRWSSLSAGDQRNTVIVMEGAAFLGTLSPMTPVYGGYDRSTWTRGATLTRFDTIYLNSAGVVVDSVVAGTLQASATGLLMSRSEVGGEPNSFGVTVAGSASHPAFVELRAMTIRSGGGTYPTGLYIQDGTAHLVSSTVTAGSYSGTMCMGVDVFTGGVLIAEDSSITTAPCSQVTRGISTRYGGRVEVTRSMISAGDSAAMYGVDLSSGPNIITRSTISAQPSIGLANEVRAVSVWSATTMVNNRIYAGGSHTLQPVMTLGSGASWPFNFVNNTVYANGSQDCVSFYNYSSAASATVINNIFDTSGCAGENYGVTSSAAIALQHNLFYAEYGAFDCLRREYTTSTPICYTTVAGLDTGDASYNNLNANPFLSAWKITGGAALNAGRNVDAYTSTDFDGDARLVGAAPDIGADEYVH